HPVGDADYFEY
nr:Chain C, Epstein-Barr nuclear antigen 1 [human gammaherpesvirus 4]4PRD_C Chain C, Epstein-Barr nuclear antigen 1 [human gammaherpesvirus 4]4PRH_C Chain C, Epstein-Barr nuclear antigen 1 [human gammaherpesvirus 4]